MKKAAALLLVGTMALGLVACGSTSGSSDTAASTADTAEAAETADTAAETAEAASYSILYNMNEGNAEGMPTYQFLGADLSGMCNYDSRLYIAIDLSLDGAGSYELTSDCYVVEADERQEVGDVSGIGLTWQSDVTGAYEENADGTITLSKGEHMTLEVASDTYSSQMMEALQFSINGESNGTWNSDETPEILEFAPETIVTVDGDQIVTYYDPNATEETTEEASTEAAAEAATEAAAAEAGAELLVAPSDDTAEDFTFYDNGTYKFYFAAYDVSDEGTYTYADGVVTITDKNGAVTTSTVDGDNVLIHYAYSDSDQLTGDFTIPQADLDAALN